jgi:WS/DGAT/MGAT family acyltransferase
VQTIERARKNLRALGSALAPGLHLPPRTPFNAAIGPHRRIEWVQTDLNDFKANTNALGGTVNDAVLAVVSGALRGFLAHRGEKISGIQLRAMVPVSVRDESERGVMGNHVASMLAELPVGDPDPRKRLETVQRAMGKQKESKNALGAKTISRLAEWAFPNLAAQAARLQIERLPFNLVVTNVPGPQFPLYFQGAELKGVYPLMPLAQGLGLGVALVSYNGSLFFGLTADWDVMPDLAVLADCIRE